MYAAFGVWSVFTLGVLYGYQGADREAEKLALTDQLLDAALESFVWLLVSNHAWLLATST